MQLVIAGVLITRIAQGVVDIHNRTWRDVREAIRKTREFKHRMWTADAVEQALEVMEHGLP